MKNKIIVTSYRHPDLDGTACAIAYAEFLNKSGQSATYRLYGNLQREVEFVFKHLKFKPKNKNLNIKNQPLVIVDMSNVKDLPKQVKPNKVIEVIDHRKVHTGEAFKNAKIQIELVGSCATLITEKFIKHKIDISKASATLLYGAVASNTINFLSPVTTSRDLKASSWLRKKSGTPKNFIKKMFIYKSSIVRPLVKVLDEDLKVDTNLNGTMIAIAQLEILNAERFLKDNLQKIIAVLKKLKMKRKSDLLFFNCIDVEKGYNLILTIDDTTKKILTSVLKIKFVNNLAKTKKIVLRKRIIPLLRTYLERK